MQFNIPCRSCYVSLLVHCGSSLTTGCNVLLIPPVCFTMTRFHIHSGDYLVIFLHLQKLMWEIKIVKTVVINDLTSINPS
ncbi:hypothetical protein E2C01_097721 [Portunus trituberculatus]|uniref:Uncharacterized protein n=1 Tax=Portunus trituberculatus TaxID=210409 RepID=A0A5B7JZE1_PORTR|nr:hypothetical protein [Portunus trituberculatus]